MRAAVYKGKQHLEVEEVPTPTPGPGQVLVRVKCCGVCGSDVHRFQHGMFWPDLIPGHEFCGVIAELGADVEGWTLGDRVIGGGGSPPPGAASGGHRAPRYTSRSNRSPTMSPGAYAEYIAMDAWRPLPVPDGISDELAALTEPGAVALHMVRLSRLRLGDTAVILGAGPIGLFALQLVRAAGAGRVFVTEPAPARRRAAEELGADRVLDPTELDVVSELVAETGGIGPDVVFDCGGAQRTLHDALEMVRREGQVMVVALAWDEGYILPVEWVGREVELKTSYGSTPREWGICLDLMQRGLVRGEPLITPESMVPLDGIQRAFEGLMSPDQQVQVLIVP